MSKLKVFKSRPCNDHNKILNKRKMKNKRKKFKKEYFLEVTKI